MAEQQMKADWFRRGESAQKTREQERARMEQPYPVQRFRVNNEDRQGRHLIVVDDEEVAVYEHEFRDKKGRWGNVVTCLQGAYDDTPCCGAIEKRDLVSHYTVIDVEGYFSKKTNKQVRYVLCDWAAKYGTQKMIEQEKTDETTLIGKRYRVMRVGEKSPKAGNNLKKMPVVPARPAEGDRPATPEVWQLDDALWFKLYRSVTFRGHLLHEMISAAKRDKAKRDALGRVFDLRSITGANGELIEGRIPTFNFYELLKPQRPEDVRRTLLGMGSQESADDFSGSGSAGGGGSTGDGDGFAGDTGTGADDVPF